MEAVGIGCFWFASRKSKKEENSSPPKHLEDIRRALEGIENISHVEILGDGTTTTHLPVTDNDYSDQNFSPIYSDVMVSFDIMMPERLQQKYASPFGHAEQGVENFHVKMVFDGGMPVAYIHYTTAKKRDEERRLSPSSAVVFIRKYLAERLENSPRIDFQILGPSPFHADVFLDVAKGQDVAGNISDTTGPRDGYRRLIVLTESETSENQIAELINDYQATLGNFYSLVRMNNHSRHLKYDVLEGATSLLDHPEFRYPWERFVYWHRYRQEIDSVFNLLLDEKMNRVSRSRFISDIDRSEQTNKNSVFYRFIQDEINSEFLLPDEDIRELLVMLEDRRKSYFENSATLFSGLFGGILGAALGAVFTYMLTTAPVTNSHTPSQQSTPPSRVLQNAP